MQTILLIGIVVECLLLLCLTLVKKITRKTFVAVSLVTALCCTVAVFLVDKEDSIRNDEQNVKGHIYMACQMVEDQPDLALNALGQLTDGEGSQYNAILLRGLAYNYDEMYATAEYLLADSEDEDAQAILSACRAAKPVDDEIKNKVIKECIESLALTDEEIRRFDAEMSIRYHGNNDDSEVIDDYLSKLHKAIANSDYLGAYDIAFDRAENGNAADNILVSEMYIRNFNQHYLAKDDEAYNALLQRLTECEIKLFEAMSASNSDENEVALQKAEYDIALHEWEKESAKRAVNYLLFTEVEETEYQIAYYLQMAKLYVSAGETKTAEELLDHVFANKTIDKTQWLATEADMLREAYLNGTGNIENPEFDVLYSRLMESLYQGIFTETASAEFADYLRTYFKELYGGIHISAPVLKDYPTVNVTISTFGEFEIAPDTVMLSDTGMEIKEFTVVENKKEPLAICFVLDRSTSMYGEPLANVKEATHSFLLNTDNEISVSLVSFGTTAKIECPLMDSAYAVSTQVDKVAINGGTNISSGLVAGAETLKEYEGKKVIILLSDGEDGFPSGMQGALNQLSSQDIVVHTIGLPGCDEDYLMDISTKSGGTYFAAEDSTAVKAIYEEIRGVLNHSYTVTYQIENADAIERSIWIEAIDSVAQSRRWYSVYAVAGQYSQIDDKQASDFFKQVGGTMGGD